MKILTPLFAVAALVGSQAAIAAPTGQMTATKTTVTTAKPMATTNKTTVAKTTKMTKATKTTGGRMVTTKTASGKTITYDCSKAGNASKKACK
ncbi:MULTISPECIES: hypothetical protein [unclassified Sphingomonas]|uniref:hypothetical protein n=1 Tax=unclassified Sphingomonas TaxID=196159 RepID=UPI001F59EB30|nr:MULTISPECIES: hypothetical protein [unclassified Sphingomonas]